jgi:hypothetical protein
MSPKARFIELKAKFAKYAERRKTAVERYYARKREYAARVALEREQEGRARQEAWEKEPSGKDRARKRYELQHERERKHLCTTCGEKLSFSERLFGSRKHGSCPEHARRPFRRGRH